MTLWSLYTLILTPARPPPKYYSPEQKMTRLELAAALDPALLMQASGRTPDPWQRKLPGSRSSRQLLLCARQTGKSTATAVIALHRAIDRPQSLVLLLSPGLRQSQELFRKLMELFDAISKKPAVLKRSAVELELVNGSRVVSLPCSEGTIRGYSGAALLVIDEASRVPDELFAAVRFPMIAASSGAIICLSTPFGSVEFFMRPTSTAVRRWERFKVTAEECPRISRQFLEEERRIHNANSFAQEYVCEFVSTSSQVFDHDLIMATFDSEIFALPWERQMFDNSGRRNFVRRDFVRKDFVRRDFVRRDFTRRDFERRDIVRREFERLSREQNTPTYALWARSRFVAGLHSGRGGGAHYVGDPIFQVRMSLNITYNS